MGRLQVREGRILKRLGWEHGPELGKRRRMHWATFARIYDQLGDVRRAQLEEYRLMMWRLVARFG